MSKDKIEIVAPEDASNRIRQTFVAGRDLNRSYVGKLLAGYVDGYNRAGKILDLVPVITDPQGLWLATVHWGETPNTPASVQQLRIPFAANVEFVEYIAA